VRKKVCKLRPYFSLPYDIYKPPMLAGKNSGDISDAK